MDYAARLTAVRAACIWTSHEANKRVPLIVQNETAERLTERNAADVGLYEELTNCLDDAGSDYGFPRRGVMAKIPYVLQWLSGQRAKKQGSVQEEEEEKVDIAIVSSDDAMAQVAE